jgi:tRNA A-37 threonylcarbamoyl transferase component Bud32
MSTLVGMQLNGRYRLDAQIGAGGMSTVYRAFDATLERRVAIKLMHREIASDSDQLERFRREARSVAQLSHPHIVGVIDAGEDDGRPYIVFEYVEGETLKDRIRRMGSLPIDEAVAYAIEITRALGAAHARGIVHRDIKPQNVLIDEEGTAKVTDFGIARSLDDEGLTAEGRVLGTTDYVSPEQALGHDVNGQSDIYSLGVVLYEMLTGDVPFHGENQVSVAMKHVREDLPDVAVRRPEISASLGSVLDRMTDKDLDRRYPDAQTLVTDLEDVLAIEAARSGRSTGEATAVLRTLPEGKRRRLPLRLRWRLPLALLLLAGAVVVALVVLLGNEAVDRTQKGTGSGTIKAPPGTRIVSVRSTSAHDYDPMGDGEEHPERARLTVDRDPGTFWTTESYSGGQITKAKADGAQPGVGIYVDAKPDVNATRIQIQSKPGWRAEIYAAPDGAVPTALDDSWTRVGGGRVTKAKQRFNLSTDGKRYRYYLVWITALPPSANQVEIDEIGLAAPQRRN